MGMCRFRTGTNVLFAWIFCWLPYEKVKQQSHSEGHLNWIAYKWPKVAHTNVFSLVFVKSTMIRQLKSSLIQLGLRSCLIQGLDAHWAVFVEYAWDFKWPSQLSMVFQLLSSWSWSSLKRTSWPSHPLLLLIRVNLGTAMVVIESCLYFTEC